MQLAFYEASGISTIQCSDLISFGLNVKITAEIEIKNLNLRLICKEYSILHSFFGCPETITKVKMIHRKCQVSA